MKIDPTDVAKRYNSLDIIIDDDDKWHLRTKNTISDFIHSSLEKISESKKYKILNAGSAGYSYGLPEDNMLHVDVADKHISHLSNSLVANIEKLPLPDKEFNMIICVGSVLNYCDPIPVMNEFSRVLKDGGYLILEFENSYTFELLFKKGFNQNAVFIETFFDAHGDKEKIWYYSEKFISELIDSYQFKELDKRRVHILSPLIYRLTNNASLSASFSGMDKICSGIPGLRRFCSNVIFLYQKNS